MLKFVDDEVWFGGCMDANKVRVPGRGRMRSRLNFDNASVPRMRATSNSRKIVASAHALFSTKMLLLH